MEPAATEATRGDAHAPAPASPLKRLLALLALVALLTSGAVTSCWILTDRADFFGAARPPRAASGE